MSLAIKSDFGEYYNALLSRPRGPDELLKDVRRDEVAERQRIEEEETYAFGDMLHIAGVWISRKKEMERGRGARADRLSVALTKTECEVWFPAVPPRTVPRPSRPGVRGFPKTAFRNLCEEEAELRRWLHGVEEKLRSHVEHACQESHFVLTCIDQLLLRERRLRARLAHEESEAIAAIRKKMFLVVPPEFYRQQVIERFGRSPQPVTEALRVDNVERTESLARERIVDEEAVARAVAHKPLSEAYDAQLFRVHRQEICARIAMEEREREELSAAVMERCRCSFGLLFYQTAAVACHVTPTRTLMLRELCRVHVADSAARAEAFRKDSAHAAAVQGEGYADVNVRAWELLFPEDAAEMYAEMNVRRHSIPFVSSNVPTVVFPPVRAADTQHDCVPVPPPVGRPSILRSASGASAQSAEGAPVALCLRKFDAKDKFAGSSNTVHFSGAIKFAADGSPLHMPTDAAGDGAGVVVPADAEDDRRTPGAVAVPAVKPRKHKARKGSFRAFHTESDDESAPLSGYR